MQKIKKLLNLWLPPFLWAVIIFTFSSFPTGTTSNFYLWDFMVKKTAHIVEYGIFATLLYRAMINSKIDKKRAMWIAVIAATFYGATDEFHQSFTPGREPRIRDVVIDATGASIFIFAVINNMNKMPEQIKKLFSKIQI